MHSFGRLVPINFLLTKPEQIEGLDAVGRLNCISPGTNATFQTDRTNAVSKDSNEDLYQIKNGSAATLIVDNIRRNFMNRQIFCNGLSHFFFLHFSAQGEWGRVNGTHSYIQDVTITLTHIHSINGILYRTLIYKYIIYSYVYIHFNCTHDYTQHIMYVYTKI